MRGMPMSKIVSCLMCAPCTLVAHRAASIVALASGVDIRSRLNRVRLVKMMAGFCSCPVPAYTRNAITVAIIGSDMAMAELAALFRRALNNVYT